MDLVPRMFLIRLYVFAREIANELGYRACRNSGFNAALVKLNRELLACLPDNQTRRKSIEKPVA